METIARINRNVNKVTFQYRGRRVDWEVIDAKLHRGRLFLLVSSTESNLYARWIEEPRNARYWTVAS